MQEKKSTASTFLFTFLYTLKKTFYLPLFGIAGISGIGFMLLNQYLQMRKYDAQQMAPGTAAPKLTDLTKYFLLGNGMATTAIAVGVVGLAGLIGLFLFRFIADKKKVNVYYSLGISRTNLFLPKLLAGVLLLTVSIVTPFLILAGASVHYFGSCPELWSAAAYMILSYLMMGLLSLMVTAAVFSSVGTLAEGIAFTAAIMLAPTLFSYLADRLMNTLVFGSAFSAAWWPTLHDAIDNALPGSLVEALTSYNPLLFNATTVNTIGELFRYNVTDKYEWVAPSFSALPFWGLAAAAVGVAAVFLFRRRRAELCGFLGRSRVLNFAAVGILGLSAFSACVLLIPGNSVWLAAAVGLVVYTLIYFAAELALLRSVKEVLRGAKKLPLHLAAAAALLLVFTTGMFGYTARVPNAEEVESVSLRSVSAAPLFSQWRGGVYRSHFDNLYYSAMYNPSINNLNGLKDEEQLTAFLAETPLYGADMLKDPAQIKAILALHEEIAKTGAQRYARPSFAFGDKTQGVPARITFVYTLKNGKSFVRYFDSTTVEMLEKFATLEQETLMDNVYEEMLHPPKHMELPEDFDYEKIDEKTRKEYLGEFGLDATRRSLYGKESIVTLGGSHMDSAVPLELTLEKKAQLIEAIKQDLIAQTAQQRLFPKNPALGTLTFEYLPQEDDPMAAGMMDGVMVSGNHGSGFFQSIIGYGDMGTRPGSETRYNIVDSLRKDILLTEDMTGTLQFLRNEGALDKLANVSKAKAARISPAVRPADVSPQDGNYYYVDPGSCAALQFAGVAQIRDKEAPPQDAQSKEMQSQMGMYESCRQLLPESAYRVTDAALLAQLEENAHLQYFLSRNGYVVEFELDNGNFVSMFVPAEKMPQAVLDAMK